MNNPWENISLEDYENHMSLDSVMQLQAMNEIMDDQFHRYDVDKVMMFGIAGGNGLNRIGANEFEKVYGVDINGDYLDECVKRYTELKNVFVPIKCDIADFDVSLPKADIVVANLFIEYVGYECFCNAVKNVEPDYVSCAVQINTDEGFVSDSPYLHAFDGLEKVHHSIDGEGLISSLKSIGYRHIYSEEKPLPNGKKLLRLDFCRA